jgi:DNA repair exonuclease SbcCD ATPase subunit
MPEVEEKVNKLEEMMMKTQLMVQGLSFEVSRTQINIRELSSEMKDFKNEIRNDTEKFKRHTDLSIENLSKEIKDFKTHTQNTTDNLSKEIKDFKTHTQNTTDNLSKELKAFCKKMQQDREKMNKKWGDLCNKWGTILEDMVIPNITTIGEKHFNCKDPIRFIIRITVKNTKTGYPREFDVVSVYDNNKIILNETKAAPKQDYMENFVSLIKDKKFFDYFPEYTGYEIIPIFSTLYFREENLKFLSNNKIYAMGIKEDTMDILNPDF